MLSKFCCCVPLRNGSIVLAILGILGGILYLATSQGESHKIVWGIFLLLVYGSLLYGALSYNKNAVLVCLVFEGMTIVLGIIFGILAIASIDTLVPQLENNCADIIDKGGLTCDQFKFALFTTAGVFIAGSLLNIYFWICIYSFYKELKEGGAGSYA